MKIGRFRAASGAYKRACSDSPLPPLRVGLAPVFRSVAGSAAPTDAWGNLGNDATTSFFPAKGAYGANYAVLLVDAYFFARQPPGLWEHRVFLTAGGPPASWSRRFARLRAPQRALFKQKKLSKWGFAVFAEWDGDGAMDSKVRQGNRFARTASPDFAAFFGGFPAPRFPPFHVHCPPMGVFGPIAGLGEPPYFHIFIYSPGGGLSGFPR